MSVLNTMLRDLERRGERLPLSLTPESPAPQEARPSPAAASIAPPVRAAAFEARQRRLPVRPTLLVATVAGAAAATWLWLHPPSLSGLRRANPATGATDEATPPPALADAPQAAPPAAVSTPPAPSAPAPQAEAPAAPAQAQTPAPTAVAAPSAATQPSLPAPVEATAQPMHPHTPTPRVQVASAANAPAVTQPDTPATAEQPSLAPDSLRVPGAPEGSVAPSELARAMQLIARGRNTEATELLTSTLSQRPASNEARSTLAALQAEAGDRQQALVTLLGGLPFDPRRFAPMAAQLQAELNDPSGALQTLDRVPSEARDPSYHNLAAAVAQRAGRHELAVAEYGTALRLGPTNAVAWVGLGVSLQALGRDAEALAAYRSAAAGTLNTELRSFTQARITALQLSSRAAATQPR
jgi:MSHA biogenesis protein MshN